LTWELKEREIKKERDERTERGGGRGVDQERESQIGRRCVQRRSEDVSCVLGLFPLRGGEENLGRPGKRRRLKRDERNKERAKGKETVEQDRKIEICVLEEKKKKRERERGRGKCEEERDKKY